MSTIREYYLSKKNMDWKSKLRNNLIKAIDNDERTYVYCKIIENKEYKFDCGKYVITDEHLLEVINFIENEGLRYYLGIKSTNYGNSTDYDDNGSFVIAWN